MGFEPTVFNWVRFAASNASAESLSAREGSSHSCGFYYGGCFPGGMLRWQFQSLGDQENEGEEEEVDAEGRQKLLDHVAVYGDVPSHRDRRLKSVSGMALMISMIFVLASLGQSLSYSVFPEGCEKLSISRYLHKHYNRESSVGQFFG